MQTATATVAGRRRVSFTLPEPAATTFIPRVDVESEGRRSTWPPTRTERYPEGLRKARAPTRSESEPGPTKTYGGDNFFVLVTGRLFKRAVRSPSRRAVRRRRLCLLAPWAAAADKRIRRATFAKFAL